MAERTESQPDESHRAPVGLGMFTHTPVVDLTPLLVPGTPEQRTYTVQPVINDVEVGVRSAPMSLLVN